ncbi:MAG: hypothetical protein AMJ79_06320 [Phycisphaerae bacterium SM23_30]|nr:MAG: hypothetical protein AMJ79_06320 [Phycisphaerae bacterium SM23_30]
MLLKSTEFMENAAPKKLFNLSDIAAEGEAILDRARRQGQEVLAQAQLQAEQIRQQAQEQGYRMGYDKGMQEGREKGLEQALREGREEFSQNSDALINTFNHFCENFEQLRDRLLFEAEQNTVALATAIAEKIVKKRGRKEPQVTEENVKAALELVTKTTDVVVKVNPRDIEHLKRIKGDDNILSQYNRIRFEADEAVEQGGCELLTGQGKVDGQLATQMERIADELLTNRAKKRMSGDSPLSPE